MRLEIARKRRGDLPAKAFERCLENDFLNQAVPQSSFVMLSNSRKPEYSQWALTDLLFCALR